MRPNHTCVGSVSRQRFDILDADEIELPCVWSQQAHHVSAQFLHFYGTTEHVEIKRNYARFVIGFVHHFHWRGRRERLRIG